MSSPVFIWAADAPLASLLVRDLEAAGTPVLLLSPCRHGSELPGSDGANRRAAVVDPSDPGAFIRPIATAVDEWGPPRGVALLPPPTPARPFHELEVDEWTTGVCAPLQAVVLVLRAALPAAALEAGARVVTVLPVQLPPPPRRRAGRAAGDALRGALAGLVQALAHEPAGQHARWLTVQGAAPGEAYDPDQVPPSTRRDGPRATAALVAWLLTAPAARLPNVNEFAARAARG